MRVGSPSFLVPSSQSDVRCVSLVSCLSCRVWWSPPERWPTLSSSAVITCTTSPSTVGAGIRHSEYQSPGSVNVTMNTYHRSQSNEWLGTDVLKLGSVVRAQLQLLTNIPAAQYSCTNSNITFFQPLPRFFCGGDLLCSLWSGLRSATKTWRFTARLAGRTWKRGTSWPSDSADPCPRPCASTFSNTKRASTRLVRLWESAVSGMMHGLRRY